MRRDHSVDAGLGIGARVGAAAPGCADDGDRRPFGRQIVDDPLVRVSACFPTQKRLPFEKTSSDAGLSDDGGQRTNLKFGVIRHWDRRCGGLGSFLHHNVAATLSNG
jgi:hypothetical protein